MGLERTTMMAAYPHVGTKDFYAAADVTALLARIRAAVEAERAAVVADTGNASGWVARVTKCRAALDALLSEVGDA